MTKCDCSYCLCALQAQCTVHRLVDVDVHQAHNYVNRALLSAVNVLSCGTRWPNAYQKALPHDCGLHMACAIYIYMPLLKSMRSTLIRTSALGGTTLDYRTLYITPHKCCFLSCGVSAIKLYILFSSGAGMVRGSLRLILKYYFNY